MPSTHGQVQAPDGTPLLIRSWPSTTAWAHVLLVHGLGEHSGRYEHVGERCAAAGLDVHAYDHRGTGQSGGHRGHVDRWTQLHDDLEDRLADLRRRSGGRPIALYGHSMGGLIVAGFCLAGRPPPDLVVLSAPGLDSTLAAWKKRLAALLGRFAPTFPIPNGVPGEALSRDPAVAARMAADPHCVTRSTARFGAEGLAEQARVRALVSRGLGVPTLVLHGEDDALVPPEATRAFHGAPRTERRTYPGLRHELHNEPEGAAIVDEVVAWLRQQVAEAPSTR